MNKFIFYSLRPAHWIKNLLIFIPLLFTHRLFEFQDIVISFWAFCSFCAAASSVYLINDLLDLERDRHHALKKMRPVACGKVSPKTAAVFAFLLGIASFLIVCFALGRDFFFVLAAYYILAVFYSLRLKHVVILDIFVLSAFYVLRILAGLVALDARMSHWMIICVALLAMFIGFNKRRHEIKFMRKGDACLHREVLSKYSTYFIDQMIAVVTAATVISYTLYTVDPETAVRFGSRGLVFTVPFVYYGIFRYLYIVHRRWQGGDPVRIFLTDRPMIINAFLWIFVCAMVIYRKGLFL